MSLLFMQPLNKIVNNPRISIPIIVNPIDRQYNLINMYKLRINNRSIRINFADYKIQKNGTNLTEENIIE